MDVHRDNRVLSLVSRPGLRNLLTTSLDQLQRCQKSLNEFLEVSWSLSYIKFQMIIFRNIQISYKKLPENR